MKFLHSMVRVLDLEESLNFYCEKLGLVVRKKTDYPDGKFTLVFLSTPNEEKGPYIELTHNWDQSEDYTNGRNFGHLAYGVENIYHYCQQLLDRGVEILRPPRDGYMAFIKSPDGSSIEILQMGDALPPESPWISMENKGSW